MMTNRNVEHRRRRAPHLFCLLLIWCCASLGSVGGHAAADPIVVYGDEHLPPYEFIEDGVAKGAIVDIWGEIGRILNRPIDYRLTDWPTAQANVRGGYGDALSIMARTPEREALYGFSQTVFQVDFSLFVRDADAAHFDSHPLASRRLGVAAGTLPQAYFARHHPEVPLTVVADSRDGLERVRRGDLDAFAVVTWTGNYYLRKLALTGVAPLPKPFATLDSAIAVPRDNAALLEQIDRALTQIRSNDAFERIAHKWAGDSVIVLNRREMWLSILALVASTALAAMITVVYFGRAKRRELAREIVEQKRIENALRESERFVRSIADNLPGMVGYWTRDLRCAFANNGYTKWFGKAPDEIVGMRLQDLLGEPLFQRNETRILAALRGEPQQFELTLATADGQMSHIWEHYIPDRQDSEICGFLVLVSDVTEIKQTQLALERANVWLLEEMDQRRNTQAELEIANAELTARSREAEQAAKAKTRFMAAVSHELRTPLHTLLGFLHLSRLDAAGEMLQHLLIAERSGTQLQKLIDELLDFAQGTEPHLRLQTEPVLLQDIVTHIERSGGLQAAEQGNHYEVAAAGDLPGAIVADERRLLQVLQNLVGNACKYTRNGTVRLQVAHADAAPPPGSCRLLFAVEDTGPGIAADEQAHIFAAFTRGKADHGQPGLGLGLSIAQEWVMAMGGEIHVASTPGVGSRFFFTLDFPLADLPHRQPSMSSLPAAPDSDDIVLPGAALTADELAAFAEMLDLGRVEAIAAWGQQLAAARPVQAVFAQHVIQLCRAADVAALERLLAALTTT